MDNKFEILLGSKQNIVSINTDMSGKVELMNKTKEIIEYDINNFLSATEVFYAERAENQIYRIYGRIEYMSLLNGLKNDYYDFEDFFSPQYSGNSKNLLNSFDFYLVRPSTGYTNISGNSYSRCFKVIATPNDFELFPVGFSNNLFGEQIYSFNFNVDIDVSNYYDEFKFPVTELYLYAQYKKVLSPEESLFGMFWSNGGASTKSEILTKTMNVDDIVKTLNDEKICDVITYNKSGFTQTQKYSQYFYIYTPYSSTRLVWKYNPFMPIRLRYLTSDLYKANTGSTSYDLVQSIPPYATEYPVNTGNFIWRNIMPEGYTDPLTGIGTNNPFVNKKRYAFSAMIFDISPDLDDLITKNAFSEVWFENNTDSQYFKPITNINNIGKPCQ
jgi:hypothetical protein